MPKGSFCFILLVSLLLFAGHVFAQSRYEIIATKGHSGLLQTPKDRELKIGDQFLALRMRDGKEILVARVRVALIDDKYCGVRITEPLSDTALAKGDYLVVEAFDIRDRLSKFETALADKMPEMAPSATETVTPAPENSNDGGMVGAADKTRPPLAPVAGAGQPEGRDGLADGKDSTAEVENEGEPSKQSEIHLGQSIVLRNPARPVLGPAFGMMMPINYLADFYKTGSQFGVQLISALPGNTQLRIGFQAALLAPSAQRQKKLDASGGKQSFWLTAVTGSVQPKLTSHIFVDLGVGYYRQFEESTVNNSTFTLSANAIGMTAGAGYQIPIGYSYRLMLIGTGNIYFPKGGHITYLSLGGAWMFAL